MEGRPFGVGVPELKSGGSMRSPRMSARGSLTSCWGTRSPEQRSHICVRFRASGRGRQDEHHEAGRPAASVGAQGGWGGRTEQKTGSGRKL
jgi:hypothetical protein